MTTHDSRDSLLDATVETRKPPVAPADEECTKCGRKPADYSDFRGWDLNLSTDEAFCPDCGPGR
jgi:hypothetical protein